MSKIETNVVKPQVNFFENETEYLILDSEWEVKLDSKINEIESFMTNNDGKGKSDDEKDELYKNAQILWREYATTLAKTEYNFYLNRDQYKFITDLILTKMDYDVNTVFFAIELTDLLGNMKNDSKYTDDKSLLSYKVNATEITYIYHLISKYKVKGLTKSAYVFAQILRRIGDISKIFNYYDTYGKNSSTDIQNWVTAFEDGVEIEKAGISEN